MLARPDVPVNGEMLGVTLIRAHHRARRFAMKQQQKLDRALESYIRLNYTNWHPDADEAAKKRFNAEVERMLKDARDRGGDPALVSMVEATDAARGPFDSVRRREEKVIATLAKKLPVWVEFAEGVRGLGAGSLGAIVGEAGDLSLYPKKGHLWKRMGLAVLDGKRQGNPGKGASAEDWIVHGYNPERRAVMWNIGECLIKQNDGAYRLAYDSRKAFELAREPEMRPIVAHARAKRYMEKRLLKDLWQAWRETVAPVPERARPRMSTAAITAVQAAE